MKTQQRIHGEFSTKRRDPYHDAQEAVLGPRHSAIGQVDRLDWGIGRKETFEKEMIAE